MALAEITLGQAQIATGSPTTLYTCPGATTALLRDMNIANTTGNTITVTVWVDPDGTTASDSTAIMKDFTILPNEFVHWSGYIILTATGTIKAQASAGSSITITACGAEIT